ncbi:MAG: putative toxin-antitoxin system toxin component, PIN family [Pirellulales bacterium]
MVPRKQRIRVVLDTNVFVRALKTRSSASPNQRIVRLWLTEKRLQLVVSDGLVDEYLGIFQDILGMDPTLIENWQRRFLADSRSSLVSLGRRYTESRDPDDNLLLATATAGKAAYLITNDLDLLELPSGFQRSLRFEVVTPGRFIRVWS